MTGETYTATLTVPGHAPQQMSQFTCPGTQEYAGPGLVPTDPGGEHSGNVGVQVSKGKVPFRTISVGP